MKKSSSLIRISVLTAMMLLAFNAKAQDMSVTKEEIIKKAWKAMFGELNSDDIKSIYLESYFHGREEPNRVYIKRPNLFRNETKNIILIFDGKRAAMINNSKDHSGNSGTLEIVDSAYWAHFEVDIALGFPAFFEYSSEYKGINWDADNKTYELYVDLPLGGNVSYFVDTESYLVTRRLVSWEGDPEKDLWENIVEGYIDYDGILFEKGYSFIGQDGRENGYFRNVKFNIETSEDIFKIPDK